MNKIINMGDYRPHINIELRSAGEQAPGAIHVYPVSYFESLIKGEDVEPLPADILRAIIKDWLECCHENLF